MIQGKCPRSYMVQLVCLTTRSLRDMLPEWMPNITVGGKWCALAPLARYWYKGRAANWREMVEAPTKLTLVHKPKSPS